MIAIAGVIILCLLGSGAFAAQAVDGALCYSAYHVQQKLDVIVQFGESVNHQKTNVDVSLHVREIPVSDQDNLVVNHGQTDKTKIRSFVFLLQADEPEISERYQHPFIVLINANSGELIDLKSTVGDPSVIKEYLSFFDLFQYSSQSGEFQYRNGNGRYQARIKQTSTKANELVRENSGYIKSAGEAETLMQIIDSVLTISLGQSSTECFYEQANGIEKSKSSLSDNVFVEGDAVYQINADATRALPANHFFYELGHQLENWPGFEERPALSRKEAFSRLPKLFTSLSNLLTDDKNFISTLLLEKDSWPHLAEYILQNELSDDFSIQLFWALDKINSTESANALAILATSPLPSRDLFRAVMSLGSTSAPLDQSSIDRIQNHFTSLTSEQPATTNSLIFVRMMGAFAKQRNTSAPLQSQQLKNYIYTQADSSNETFNAAVIDAIGNLGSSIDIEGEQILFNGLTEGSRKIRQSAADAFSRIPYDKTNSELFIEQINNESNTQIKSSLINVLSKTDSQDMNVKQYLLQAVKDSGNAKISNQSLSSLKKIDFALEADEIKILESKLKQETDRANQRLLAALILKHRRGQ